MPDRAIRDDLAAVSTLFYFYELMGHAAAHGLPFLAEADLADRQLRDAPRKITEPIAQLPRTSSSVSSMSTSSATACFASRCWSPTTPRIVRPRTRRAALAGELAMTPDGVQSTLASFAATGLLAA